MSNIEFDKIIKSLPEAKDILDIKEEEIYFNTNDLIEFISEKSIFQDPDSLVYKTFKKLLIAKYALHYQTNDMVKEILGININFPFISLGTINSRHFFGIDELLIYDFYKRNTKRYKYVADIGCNCGLHSKILCELGYEVDSYEPDITHLKFAKEFLKEYKKNTLYESAVSSYNGKAIFTRILNNSTGSYINDKKTSYGPVEKYEVNVLKADDILHKYDLIKMDIEGSEGDVLLSLNKSIFDKVDIIAEVSTEKTRKTLYDFFKTNNIKVYSQKNGWNQVVSINNLPTSHREGSIFISQKNKWI